MELLRGSAFEEGSFGPESGIGSRERVVSGRRSFIRRGAAAAAGALAAFAGRETLAQSGNPNYLPSLYPGENGTIFTQIMHDENNHVAFLKDALGDAAIAEPTFVNINMSTLQAFAQTSQALETTGVGAYLGAARYIDNPAYLITAAQIMDIEARHSGYLNVLLNLNILQNGLGQVPSSSLEQPLSYDQVMHNASPFLPNGVTLPMYSTTPSPANDIVILNFALALEYLESSFYNLNVPKFL